VAAVPATTGAVANGELLTWTGTERLIGVDLDAQLEDLVEEGTAATVTLPDGTTAEAEVTEVGTPTTPPAGAGGEAAAAAGEAAEATLPVELRVADQAALGRYQAARVDVTLDAETREDVLAVPVHALAARPGGGYAVEAVTGDTTAYVPVEVGLFANGMVEISGDGVAEGTVVGVPR
jgi:multidrug efflux pump subunit AcrA (membrane-fusion protein)